MLQNVRDNMKGTLIVVVILLFIVPMVITGVDGSFLGGVAGTDAAKVEGETISEMDLARAIYMRRQQIVAQTGGDAGADYLNDKNLRDPVLNNMVRRLALIRTAQKAGMGVSDELVIKEILQQTEFHTDGKYDKEKFKRLLRGANYTPATYRAEVASNLLLNQQAFGLEFSSFVTEGELDSLISVIQQQRSFYTVTIPKKIVDDSIEVTDEERKSYYELNKNDFIEAEKVKVDYIELSVDELSNNIHVSEEEIKNQYQQEVTSFKANSRYEVAHLLIEDRDDKSQDQIITTVTEKLAAGTDFDALVKEYSDDIASKESGGELGVLTLGMFPSEFEKAALALDEGAVSAPVKTDAGTHFIKVLKKTTTEVPDFEERRTAIKKQLATIAAEEIFVESLSRLGDLTFSSDGLASAAKELNLKVKTTAYFERGFGAGIAKEKSVRDAAYSDDVLIKKHNSSVIEIGSNKAYVIYVADHVEEHVRDFDMVKEEIETVLLENKKQAQLLSLSQEFLKEVQKGENAETLAKSLDYEYSSFEDAKRQDVAIDRNVLQMAFSVITDGSKTVFDTQSAANGDQVLVAVTSVKAGDRSALDKQQLVSFKRQLAGENSRFEGAVFEAKVVESAKISTN